MSHDASHAPDELGGLGQEGGGIVVATSYLSALISTFTASATRDEDGQGLVEYGLILVLIAIVAVVSLVFFGTTLSKMLSTVGASV